MRGASDQAGSRSAHQALSKAILSTVAYADVFDYPLTLAQIHRYLIGVAALPSTVRNVLHGEALVSRQLGHSNGYYCLAGREAIIETRLYRAEVAARIWPKAQRYALSIASLPFVRMVAITGTLAMNNVDPNADIDCLIVTVPHRVWLARSLSIAFVYLGRLENVELCPNYVLSLDALDQFDRSFFSAHEIAQMVPLYGLDIYSRLIHANSWAKRHLPNAFGTNAFNSHAQGKRTQMSRIRMALKRSAENILGATLGDYWERRESSRKMDRLTAEAACSGTNAAAFTPECCKGHLNDHGERIRQAYARRLRQLGLEPQAF